MIDQPQYSQFAVAEDGDLRIRAALQGLLAERFHLEFHRDSKTMPAYALVVSKSGFKLKEVESTGRSSSNSNRGKLTATGVSMERLSDFLASQMSSPVVDMSGIKGVFNFTLEWSPDELQRSDSADKSAGPSIFTALQEQLGLKLEAKKAPVAIIVVDRAEKPADN